MNFIYEFLLLTVVIVTRVELKCIKTTDAPVVDPFVDDGNFKAPLLQLAFIETTKLAPQAPVTVPPTTTDANICGMIVPSECKNCNISYDDYGCFTGCTCQVFKKF